jgi:hypothetical protein
VTPPGHDQLVYWITEREAMRLRKEENLLPPWSDNPVMCNTYFCNIDREDDRVTKWIRHHWRLEYTTPEDYPFAMIMARMFNLPSTLQAIGIPSGPGIAEWQLQHAKRIILDLQKSGQTIFSGAYVVSTNGKKMGKVDYLFGLFEQMVKQPILYGKGLETCAEAHKQLMEVEGLASFMAAQVVADLKNTKGYPLYNAPDKRTFSAYGPGSLRGLGWYHGGEIKPRDYHAAINEAMDELRFDLPDSILAKLCMQNLQNCFCEFDKFMRVTNGTGRSKRKYEQKFMTIGGK